MATKYIPFHRRMRSVRVGLKAVDRQRFRRQYVPAFKKELSEPYYDGWDDGMVAASLTEKPMPIGKLFSEWSNSEYFHYEVAPYLYLKSEEADDAPTRKAFWAYRKGFCDGFANKCAGGKAMPKKIRLNPSRKTTRGVGQAGMAVLDALATDRYLLKSIGSAAKIRSRFLSRFLEPYKRGLSGKPFVHGGSGLLDRDAYNAGKKDRIR